MRSVIPVARSVQSVRMAELYLKYLEPKRDWLTKIRWFYGPSGTGKSRTAREIFKDRDYYTTMRNGKWWEGYDGHENIIIDDIREHSYKYEDMLAMLDRYEFRVECKGGSRQLLAKEIIITCPKHPEELFAFSGEDNTQLIRRIHEIREFNDEIIISQEDIEHASFQQENEEIY